MIRVELYIRFYSSILFLFQITNVSTKCEYTKIFYKKIYDTMFFAIPKFVTFCIPNFERDSMFVKNKNTFVFIWADFLTFAESRYLFLLFNQI